MQHNSQPDVTIILKRLRRGENMTDLDNKRVINLEQFNLPQPANPLRRQTKSWHMKGNQHEADCPPILLLC